MDIFYLRKNTSAIIAGPANATTAKGIRVAMIRIYNVILFLQINLSTVPIRYEIELNYEIVEMYRKLWSLL